MKVIIQKKEQYEIIPHDAIITEHTIIPGLKGQAIDINKSYDKMKRLGYFNETLLVYNEIKPKKTIFHQYSKIIVSGNKQKKKISLIFNIKNIDFYNEITTIIKKYNLSGNYYFKNNLLINNIKVIKDNNAILVSNLIDLEKYFSYINYCLTEKLEIPITCLNNKKYTILIKKNIDNYHLTYLKNNLQNGDIIMLTFNKNNVNDIPLIINYINSQHLEIVSLNDLLKE